MLQLANVGRVESEGTALKDEKPDKREESAWVTVARYSEIGFIVPMSVVVGYFFGLLADHFLHTHWIFLFGIIFGAVAGFVSLIRRALQSSKDLEANDAEAEKDKQDDSGGNGSHTG